MTMKRESIARVEHELTFRGTRPLMRSFRARIERGRIIVHEPLDLPDGVVYLVAVEEANADPAPAPRVEPGLTARTSIPPSAEGDHRSSS